MRTQLDNLSLYGQYIKEHRGDEIIETEWGFATYRFLDEKTVYIIDIFIVPTCRNNKNASAIADEVVSAAKLRGCTKLMGTVVPSAKNSTASLKVLLGYGMKLQSCTNDCIIFEKEI